MGSSPLGISQKMRIGIYLGRHAGSGGGIGVYARAFVEHIFTLLGEQGQEETEVVFYGTKEVLSQSLVEHLELSPVLFVKTGTNFFWGAGNYFRRLPNGARCRVMLRLLPSEFGRYGGLILDQFLLPLLIWRDGVDLIHSLANYAVLACPVSQIVTVHDFFQAWPLAPTAQSEYITGYNRSESIRRSAMPLRLEAAPLQTKSRVNFWEFLRKWYYRALFAAQFKVVSHVITDTASVATETYRRYGFNRASISIVPLGLDACFSEFADLGDRLLPLNQAFLKKYEIKAGYILAFAAGDERKNLLRTLEAWFSLEPKQRRLGLVLKVADCDTEEQVKKLLKQSGKEENVRLLNWLERSEMPFLYFNAAVVLVPTIAEGFGLPVCEALALRKRVVSAPLEILTSPSSASEDVFFCDPLDVRSIKNALTLAIEAACLDSRELTDKNNWGKVLKPWRSMKDTLRESFDIYRQVLLRSS